MLKKRNRKKAQTRVGDQQKFIFQYNWKNSQRHIKRCIPVWQSSKQSVGYRKSTSVAGNVNRKGSEIGQWLVVNEDEEMTGGLEHEKEVRNSCVERGKMTL